MSRFIRELRADCSRCCGLCCVAPAFDAAQGFGYDKPARRPCRHLDRSDRCCIHDSRATRGFVACTSFDCYGAGQWVTQRLQGGQSWRESAARARTMFESYRRFRALHEMLAAIALLRDRGIGASAPHLLEQLQARVEAACRQEEASPGSIAIEPLRRDVLRSLGAMCTG